jgi:hypothetical protein
VGSVTPANQIHDFNPGISPFPLGLFWTIPFDASAVAAQLGAGKASFRVQNSAERDFHKIGNALANGPSDPATVSFDVEWSGAVDRGHFSDSANRFQLDFVDTGATISWSGVNQTSGATFTSGPNNTPGFARLAHERNGRFFNSGA